MLFQKAWIVPALVVVISTITAVLVSLQNGNPDAIYIFVPMAIVIMALLEIDRWWPRLKAYLWGKFRRGTENE